MKMPALKSRDGRALLLGGILLVPALLYTFVLAPAWRGFTAHRAEVVQQRNALQRDRDLIRRTSEMQARNAETTKWLASEARRLFGHDELAATSDLTEYVNEAAAVAGLQLRQTETQPVIPVLGALRAIRLNIRAEGTAQAVITFLHRVETGNRLVRIGQLTAARRAGSGDAGGSSGGGGGGSFVPPPGMPPERMRAITRRMAARGGINPDAADQVSPTPAPNATPELVSISAHLYGYVLVPPPRGVRVLSSEEGVSYTALDGRTVAIPEVGDALSHNPFSPLRSDVLPQAQPRQPTVFPIKLVGTVLRESGGSFAVCQVRDGPPQIVRPGERIEGYVLRDLAQGRAVLIGPKGQRVQLTLPTPGA